MRYRKLRIVWSVSWGLAAVLMVLLWERSYWRWDLVCFYGVTALSQSGRMTVGVEKGYKSAHLDYATEPTFRNVVEFGEEQCFGFGVFSGPHYAGVKAPTWFLILATATAAAVPWRRRLKWHFSLRTLLVATTVVAALLGLIVYAAQ